MAETGEINMNGMKLLSDTFIKKVVPAGASPGQIRDMTSAFYAGAYALLNLALQAADDQYTEDQGARILAKVEQEIKDYFNELEKS